MFQKGIREFQGAAAATNSLASNWFVLIGFIARSYYPNELSEFNGVFRAFQGDVREF